MASGDSAVPIWCGFECTVSRIGDEYRDQLCETGHMSRPADIDQVADLGIKTVRHAVLWEHVYRAGTRRPDWGQQDDRLQALRDRGITPIVGLLHHGSGPPHTNLLDPDFATRFADFAGEVAERYPWVGMYTPINEPLTTARFSCLYGHWYPHQRDQGAFLRALFNQVGATALAMIRIRRTAPSAQLIQTEDVGKVFATPQLQYQSRYENARRWLSLDLLCGRINGEHPWFQALVAAGVEASALAELCSTPCAPDIVGLNHYLSSDRYLDQRYWLYRPSSHGGNGQEAYADIEAHRAALPARELGMGARIREIWERYRLPIAITEVHNGCTREEQLRWLMEAMKAANEASAAGIDLRALTIWAIAGLVDWDSLLTRRDGHYESGVIEVHDGLVRRTGLAGAVKCLVNSGTYDHPVLDTPGWWRRSSQPNVPPIANAPDFRTARRLLIAGGRGALGQAFSRICIARGLDHDVMDRTEFDICDPAVVQRVLTDRRPWAVINAAGFASSREAERNPTRCHRENSLGPAVLAGACANLHIQLLTFSTDKVFDGHLGRPYVEGDIPSSTRVLGASKADAERLVLSACDLALVVRAGEFFGPGNDLHFLTKVLSTLAAGQELRLAEETRFTPAYLPDVVHRALDLLIDGERGIWHLANAGAISRSELARGAAVRAGLPAELVIAGEFRGASTELASERGPLLPSLTSALDRFFLERNSA
jgi:dTDP-4-dehydrorhamnose reductase